MLSVKTKAFIIPTWHCPSNVQAVITSREGGLSLPPYHSNNLALHVGDDATHVLANRAQLQSSLDNVKAIQWLNQVHGTEVVRAAAGDYAPDADAQYSHTIGLACAILTADCLPVLFCDRQGTQVAGAHAGWRGLAQGVLINTVNTFADPRQVMAYLGPAIGPEAFEVGPEVKEAFAGFPEHCFKPGVRDRYWADIYALARHQLQQMGVEVFGGGYCTFTQADQFYSYRRSKVTGRMASLIWLSGNTR